MTGAEGRKRAKSKERLKNRYEWKSTDDNNIASRNETFNKVMLCESVLLHCSCLVSFFSEQLNVLVKYLTAAITLQCGGASPER
jgi:hypothetical protein